MIPALEPVWKWLELEVFTQPSIDGPRPLLNYYRDGMVGIDRPNAAAARRSNLKRMLESYSELPAWLLVGEAPGWRGCRFTGVPFTSEMLILNGSLKFSGEPTSLRSAPLSEASATIFQNALAAHALQVFAWNCLPYHPYPPTRPLSNRTPTSREIHTYLPLLLDLMGMLRPVQVIAVGRCAESALRAAEVPCQVVRHPSHGGATRFRYELAAILARTDPVGQVSST